MAKIKLVLIPAGAEEDALVAQEGNLGCPEIYRDREGWLYVKPDELRAWRASQNTSASQQSK